MRDPWDDLERDYGRHLWWRGFRWGAVAGAISMILFTPIGEWLIVTSLMILGGG